MSKSKNKLVDEKIATFVYIVVECVVFLFALIATPIAQFKLEGFATMCITMWGLKLKCDSTKYDARGADAFGCDQAKNNMAAAAAFSILSIVVLLAAIAWGFLLILQKVSFKWIRPILALVATVFLLICWACVAGVYTSKMCEAADFEKYSYKEFGYRYGAGFGLMVTAWVLQLLIFAFVCIVMFV